MLKSNQILLGLELGLDCLHLAALTQSWRGYRLLAWHTQTFTSDSAMGGTLPTPAALTSALQQTLSSLAINQGDVCLGLADNLANNIITSQMLHFDKHLAPREFVAYLTAHPESFGLTSLANHYFELSPIPTASTHVQQLFTLAKTRIDPLLAACKTAGLRVTAIDLTYHALERAYRCLYQVRATNFGVLHLEAQQIKLYCFIKTWPVFERTLTFTEGLASIQSQLVDTLNCLEHQPALWFIAASPAISANELQWLQKWVKAPLQPAKPRYHCKKAYPPPCCLAALGLAINPRRYYGHA